MARARKKKTDDTPDFELVVVSDDEARKPLDLPQGNQEKKNPNQPDGSSPKLTRKVPTIADSPDKRQELGLWLYNMTEKGQNAKGGLPAIWDEIERQVRDEMPDAFTTQGEGEAVTHIPQMSPRAETLSAQCNTIILDQEPYMLCKGLQLPNAMPQRQALPMPAMPTSDAGATPPDVGPSPAPTPQTAPQPTPPTPQPQTADDISTNLENLLHRQWQDGGIEQATREGTMEAFTTNRFMYKQSFEIVVQGLLSEGDDQIQRQAFGPSLDIGGDTVQLLFSGLKFEGICANDFIIGPSTIKGVQSAVIVGHRFWQTITQIKERVKLGLYFDPDKGYDNFRMLGGGDPSNVSHALGYYHAMVSPEVWNGEEETMLAECYEVYVRKAPAEDKRTRWYKAVIAKRAQFILSFEEWNYTRPPYFKSEYLVDKTGFWGGRSVGRKMVPLQSESDRVATAIYNSTLAAASPPVFTSSEIDGEDYTQFEQFDAIHIEEGDKPWSPPNDFEAAGLTKLWEGLQQAADATIQINNNSLGANDPNDTSATETAAKQQAMSVRLGEYVRCFTAEWGAMAAFSCELLYDNWEFWRPYNLDIEIKREHLALRKSWVVNGSTPAATPANRRAEIAQLIQLAAMPPVVPNGSGLNFRKLVRMGLKASTLPGAEGLQDEEPNPQQQPGAAGPVGGQPAVPNPAAQAPPQIPPGMAHPGAPNGAPPVGTGAPVHDGAHAGPQGPQGPMPYPAGTGPTSPDVRASA